jgi:hypothetical protein
MSTQRPVAATPVPPIHWPSAFVGLVLAVVLVVGISWLAAPRPIVRSQPAVAAAPAVPTPAPTPIPAPAVAEPAPAPPAAKVKVAFTNGSGVNLRAKASERGQWLKSVPADSVLEIIGADVTADGMTWRNVRDATGSSGYVAGKFVAELRP